MKKFLLAAITILLALSMLVGCNNQQAEAPVATEPSAAPTETAASPSEETAPTETTQPASQETTPIETTQPASQETTPTEATQPTTVETTPAKTEDDTSSDSVDAVYAKQIEKYYTALSNQWDESAYFENEMSPMAVYYYDGNALDNVGYAVMDLNGDNIQELMIGAILNAERDPLVFEIWTLNNGEPVMLAQSGSRNRYYLQYAEDDQQWTIAYEAENGAANHAVYYLHLSDGNFEVIQGVIYDAFANENEPWFMAYDLDWDISNDTPIDEETANAVMEAGRNIYTHAEYRPYSLYK